MNIILSADIDKLEKLADLAHKSWSGWMEHLFEKSESNEDGTVVIPKELVERWKRQIETKYEDLSDDEKESDRKEARKVLKILEAKLEVTAMKEKIKQMLKDGKSEEEIASTLQQIKTKGLDNPEADRSQAIKDIKRSIQEAEKKLATADSGEKLAIETEIKTLKAELNPAGKKADADEIEESLNQLDEALGVAIDAANETYELAAAKGGELDRVVAGQLSGYMIGTLEAFRSSENQTGSITSLKNFLQNEYLQSSIKADETIHVPVTKEEKETIDKAKQSTDFDKANQLIQRTSKLVRDINNTVVSFASDVFGENLYGPDATWNEVSNKIRQAVITGLGNIKSGLDLKAQKKEK